jgi:glutamate 5-kinase
MIDTTTTTCSKWTIADAVEERRDYIQKSRKIVLKLGTKVLLSHYMDINKDRIARLIDDIACLRDQGFTFSIVTSGAVGFGMNLLGLEKRPNDLKKIQACASIGQSLLMQKWNELFARKGILAGQILLTYDIIESRKRFLHARDCLREMIRFGAVPIINENDSVAVDELKFGDNDTLSALTASLMDADLLVLFTDTDGLYDKNPHKHPDASRIPFIEEINGEVMNLIEDKRNDLSTGGMLSKLLAAQRCVTGGAAVVITDGMSPDLAGILSGKDIGTFIKPDRKFTKKRKRWIFFNHKIKGKIIVDDGAENALLNHSSSLLPGGVIGTEDDFESGSIVGIFNADHQMIGKGITNYSSSEVLKLKGRRTEDLRKTLVEPFHEEIVHRDNMIIL